MAYIDAQFISGTGSATANTEVELDSVSIPAGVTWKLKSIWCGTSGAGGGTYRIAVSTYPQAEFKFIQEGLSNVSIGTATADTHATELDTVIVGPASISGLVTNVGTSKASRIQLTYLATGGPTN
tara:strand:+ start:515 stop:889 length:375 start_codon:yes stop_codon:yes gene_type:complete